MGSKQTQTSNTVQITNNNSTEPLVVQSPIQPSSSPTAVQPSIPETTFNFKSFVQSSTQSLLRVGPWIRQQKADINSSQLANSLNNFRNCVHEQVSTPISHFYKNFPEQFTEAKFELIRPYSEKSRFITLSVFCALTAIVSLKSAKVNPISRMFISTRNVGMVYLLGGLVIVPEIYNPFIQGSKSD